MKNKIYLLPLGKVEEDALEILSKRLKKTFVCQIGRLERMKLPAEAFNPSRNQYYSSLILKKIKSSLKLKKEEKVLAVVDVDLYVPELNFVFGEAELGGQLAIISLFRLHQGFYGLKENKELFLSRAVKEAVHELGHTFGLGHCPDPRCVMHFSNSLLDTDRKSASFCRRCQQKLKERIKE
ncbi:MAG: archaemetzincin family Zn-dependent metalloprotease [Candidatus Aminicenantales bacterium]